MELADLAINGLTGLIGASGGGSAVYAIAKAMIERHLVRVTELERDMKAMRDMTITRLEKDIDSIKANCKADQNSVALINLLGWMKKIDFKLDGVSIDTAAIKSELAQKQIQMGNMEHTVQGHVQDHQIHGGRR